VDISARTLLSYAAGIGADWALDDAASGGLTGFPTFCASLEFNAFRGPLIGDPGAVGLADSERVMGVHAGQDSTFHQPLRPGQRLRTTGTIVEVAPIKAGALIVVRAETTDRDTGEAVTTSLVSNVMRGVAVVGETAERAPAPPAPTGEGEPAHRVAIPVTRALPHVYAECAQIWNPIHSERQVALAAGLPDIILQGSATWSLVAREVVAAFCDRDAARLKRLACRFSGMVVPGDELIVEQWAPQAGVVQIAVTNQDGRPVLTHAFAEIA
jgi:acyl dehydratase